MNECLTNNTIKLPKWLDDLLFQNLGARFCKSNADITVIDWDKNEILNYLGTYFPRSFAESLTIFNEFFTTNKARYLDQSDFYVFDFGCGTGGEIVGLIMAITKTLPNINKIYVKALDGNVHSLRLLEKIINKLNELSTVTIDIHIFPVTIDDFYDMDIVLQSISETYDMVLSFKAICEFTAKQRFNNKNPYEHIVNCFSPKLNDRGVICLADITSFCRVSNSWLPTMLDKVENACCVELVARNKGFNTPYSVSHSRCSKDISKIAWRIFKNKQI